MKIKKLDLMGKIFQIHTFLKTNLDFIDIWFLNNLNSINYFC